jgi:uncharacterized membrane protein YphA (DoxX/SURF4 family)
MVGLTAAAEGTVYLLDAGRGNAGEWVVPALLIPSGVSLLGGFLTPPASILAGAVNLVIVLSWLPLPPLSIFHTHVAIIQTIVTSISIAFLGPGAFSFDAHFFGRREINIPKAPPTAKR